MTARTLPSGSVKVVGVNDQISLGKQFAGWQVLVEEQAEGVWLICTHCNCGAGQRKVATRS